MADGAGRPRAMAAYVALVLALAGCAHEHAPAQARRTTPTFASELPEECEVGDLGGPSALGAVEVDERSLCASISHRARVSVAAIPGGVAVYLEPRTPSDLPALRATVATFERAMDARWLERGRETAHERCGLLDIALLGGRAATDYVDGAARMRITTSDPAIVPALRREAQRFAAAEDRSR